MYCVTRCAVKEAHTANSTGLLIDWVKMWELTTIILPHLKRSRAIELAPFAAAGLPRSGVPHRR